MSILSLKGTGVAFIFGFEHLQVHHGDFMACAGVKVEALRMKLEVSKEDVEPLAQLDHQLLCMKIEWI